MCWIFPLILAIEFFIKFSCSDFYWNIYFSKLYKFYLSYEILKMSAQSPSNLYHKYTINHLDRQSKSDPKSLQPEASRTTVKTWWHQMETFSALLAFCVGNSPVTGEFPSQRPVTWNFDVFFDLHLNKQLSKHLWRWWFDTLSRSLWRHCKMMKFTQDLESQLIYQFRAQRPQVISLEDITVTSHEHHGVSNWIYPTACSGLHRIQHQSLALWDLCEGNRWLVVYHHKGPVMQKGFPYRNIIMTVN